MVLPPAPQDDVRWPLPPEHLTVKPTGRPALQPPVFRGGVPSLPHALSPPVHLSNGSSGTHRPTGIASLAYLISETCPPSPIVILLDISPDSNPSFLQKVVAPPSSFQK